jgi:hypothetical protein
MATAKVQSTALNCDGCGNNMYIEGLGSKECTATCMYRGCVEFGKRYKVNWPQVTLTPVGETGGS